MMVKAQEHVTSFRTKVANSEYFLYRKIFVTIGIEKRYLYCSLVSDLFSLRVLEKELRNKIYKGI